MTADPKPSRKQETPSPGVERALLRYPEAAYMLNLSEDAVAKLVANGELKVIRPGLFAKGNTSRASRVVLIPVSEIHAWIERQLAAQSQPTQASARSAAITRDEAG